MAKKRSISGRMIWVQTIIDKKGNKVHFEASSMKRSLVNFSFVAACYEFLYHEKKLTAATKEKVGDATDLIFHKAVVSAKDVKSYLALIRKAFSVKTRYSDNYMSAHGKRMSVVCAMVEIE